MMKFDKLSPLMINKVVDISVTAEVEITEFRLTRKETRSFSATGVLRYYNRKPDGETFAMIDGPHDAFLKVTIPENATVEVELF